MEIVAGVIVLLLAATALLKPEEGMRGGCVTLVTVAIGLVVVLGILLVVGGALSVADSSGIISVPDRHPIPTQEPLQFQEAADAWARGDILVGVPCILIIFVMCIGAAMAQVGHGSGRDRVLAGVIVFALVVIVMAIIGLGPALLQSPRP